MRDKKTKEVKIGNVSIGGGNPIAIQSMLNCDPCDPDSNLEQIDSLYKEGCEIIRVSVPNRACINSFKTICKKSPIPVVADIHFSPSLAMEAIKAGAFKIRINPGNLGGLDKCIDIINLAKQYGVAIRIGVNAGSLDEKLKSREDISLSQKLFLSAKEYIEFFSLKNFDNIVVSAKAHDVKTTVETYRLIYKNFPNVPLHLGITEAGTKTQGIIKSSAGLGILLNEGIGDTIRISLTASPVEEVRVAKTLLNVLGIRRSGVEIISCPTCGRTKVDLISIANKIERSLTNLSCSIKVAVMGCVVNGPGEAEGADIGVACGLGEGSIFINGKIIKKVSEDEIVDTLLKEINLRWNK